MKNYDLDTVLIQFSNEPASSNWTIRNAVEGTQVFGGIGSGKSSGSGTAIAIKFLENGFGGLVLSAKDESDTWIKYCTLTNRLDDLIIVRPGSKNYFNFLEYESAAKDGKKTITDNIVQVLRTVIQASEEKNGGQSDQSFWRDALDLLLFNVIELAQLAYGKVSVKQLYDIVVTAPKPQNGKPEKVTINTFAYAFQLAQARVKKQVDQLLQSLPKSHLRELEDLDLIETYLINSLPDAYLLKSIDQFFVEQYRMLAEKTRSIIDFSFSTFLLRLLREPIYSLFCKHESTFTPDDCLNGKIILLDIPVKIYHKAGRDSQILFKYIWQRAMEKRVLSDNDRPVFLWADEAQHFLHEYDSDYQATARSSRIATVYISQNIPNYHANMGSAKSEHRVNSFLGTLGTQIFHANTDRETNKYGSELFGQAYTEDVSRSTSGGKDFSFGASSSFKLEYLVRPEQFVNLKSGSKRHNFLVDTYFYMQGQPFKSELNFKKVTFKQTEL